MMKKLNHYWVNHFKYNCSNLDKIRNKEHHQLSITKNKSKQKIFKKSNKFICKTKIADKIFN